MHKLLAILCMTFLLATELEVDGNLKVTGNIIFSDSSYQSTAPIILPSFNGISEFSSTTNWIVPDGVKSIYVELWGGGGAGNNGTNCDWEVNGGAGGYLGAIIPVSPNDTLIFNIGGSGTMGGWSPDCGSDGADSYISSLNGEVFARAFGGRGSCNGCTGSGAEIYTGSGIIRYGGSSNCSNCSSKAYGFEGSLESHGNGVNVGHGGYTNTNGHLLLIW